MRLLNLRAINFRNLTDINNFELTPDIRNIFFIGNNGQGKTNILEAIYYLCFGSSFRTNLNKRIIQNGKNYALLGCTFIDDDGSKRNIHIKIFENKVKEIFIDSKKISDRKTLIENTACIVFTHEDMVFINGSPEKKRWFINQTTSLVNYQFIDLLRDYNKILKNRNTALKKRQFDIFTLYDEKLVEYGLLIKQTRLNVVNEFNRTLKEVFSEIVGNTDIELVYRPSWISQTKEEIFQDLRKSQERDILHENTTKGPHRDNFEYMNKDGNYVHYASTGQIRLLSLILRIAQLKFVARSTNKKHVVLIDDVLLELDPEKREGILKQLTDYEQAFFTFLPDERIVESEMTGSVAYLIDNGRITEWKKQAI